MNIDIDEYFYDNILYDYYLKQFENELKSNNLSSIRRLKRLFNIIYKLKLSITTYQNGINN